MPDGLGGGAALFLTCAPLPPASLPRAGNMTVAMPAAVPARQVAAGW